MSSNLKIGATETSPVYFCYGASGERGHTLTAVGEASSPWVGHGVSVNPATGQTLPFQTVPVPGEYQTFSEQGCKWKVNCPDDGEELAVDCRLQAEYTAKPYSIAVQLGHYLREFLGKRNPISTPVIDDEITAEVQVVSAYTQKLLKDVEVQWFVDGEPVSRNNTNDSGWSKFSHIFTAEGEHPITAKVFSPYNDAWTEHSFPIKVYADSPWKQAELKVNGLPLSWLSTPIFFRGQANEVTVKVESSIAETLRLALFNEDGLTIDTEPAGDVWQKRDTVTGLFKWILTSKEEVSGRFSFIIYSGEVAQQWEHHCLLLSPNLEDEVDLLITQSGGTASPVDLKGEGLILTKDHARLTMTLPPSSPLIGRTVAFKWKGDANPSVVLPAPFVMTVTTVVEINGVDNPASLKRHQLCLDYGGAVTESWMFRYFRGLPSSGLSIWCDGVNHGADSLLLKFNKNYELSIRPKAEDSVFVGWKCKFIGVVEQGIAIELLPPSVEFVEIGSPASGGAKKTIRARDAGGGVGRKVYMDVQVKDFGVLKVPIEIV